MGESYHNRMGKIWGNIKWSDIHAIWVPKGWDGFKKNEVIANNPQIFTQSISYCINLIKTDLKAARKNNHSVRWVTTDFLSEII